MLSFDIGETVLVLIGENKVRGRISRQTSEDLIKKGEYFVHTILGTFFVENEYIFKSYETI